MTAQVLFFNAFSKKDPHLNAVETSPSEAIIFIDQLYDDSTSDKEVVGRGVILDPRFWEEGDLYMADLGFTIADDFIALNVELNIPEFLSDRDQLTKANVKESKSIASDLIHVERAIGRIKTFRLIRNEIPLAFYRSINQVWAVTCLLCYFLQPLIEKAYSENE